MNKQSLEKNREYQARYRQKHRERVNASNRAWKKKVTEKIQKERVDSGVPRRKYTRVKRRKPRPMSKNMVRVQSLKSIGFNSLQVANRLKIPLGTVNKMFRVSIPDLNAYRMFKHA